MTPKEIQNLDYLPAVVGTKYLNIYKMQNKIKYEYHLFFSFLDFIPDTLSNKKI